MKVGDPCENVDIVSALEKSFSDSHSFMGLRLTPHIFEMLISFLEVN